MKPTEVRTKSDDELKESLVGLRKEAFNLRFQRASGQLENTARVRGIRRDIARIKTVLTERRPGGAGRPNEKPGTGLAAESFGLGASAPGGATPAPAGAAGTKSKAAPAKKAKTAKRKAKSA